MVIALGEVRLIGVDGFILDAQIRRHHDSLGAKVWGVADVSSDVGGRHFSSHPVCLRLLTFVKSFSLLFTGRSLIVISIILILYQEQ